MPRMEKIITLVLRSNCEFSSRLFMEWFGLGGNCYILVFLAVASFCFVISSPVKVVVLHLGMIGRENSVINGTRRDFDYADFSPLSACSQNP